MAETSPPSWHSTPYMDSRAGYYALEMSKQCVSIPERELMPKIASAMRELDSMVSRKGRQFGCRWVDGIEQSIANVMPR